MLWTFLRREIFPNKSNNHVVVVDKNVNIQHVGVRRTTRRTSTSRSFFAAKIITILVILDNTKTFICALKDYTNKKNVNQSLSSKKSSEQSDRDEDINNILNDSTPTKGTRRTSSTIASSRSLFESDIFVSSKNSFVEQKSSSNVEQSSSASTTRISSKPKNNFYGLLSRGLPGRILNDRGRSSSSSSTSTTDDSATLPVESTTFHIIKDEAGQHRAEDEQHTFLEKNNAEEQHTFLEKNNAGDEGTTEHQGVENDPRGTAFREEQLQRSEVVASSPVASSPEDTQVLSDSSSANDTNATPDDVDDTRNEVTDENPDNGDDAAKNQDLTRTDACCAILTGCFAAVCGVIAYVGLMFEGDTYDTSPFSCWWAPYMAVFLPLALCLFLCSPFLCNYLYPQIRGWISGKTGEDHIDPQQSPGVQAHIVSYGICLVIFGFLWTITMSDHVVGFDPKLVLEHNLGMIDEAEYIKQACEQESGNNGMNLVFHPRDEMLLDDKEIIDDKHALNPAKYEDGKVYVNVYGLPRGSGLLYHMSVIVGGHDWDTEKKDFQPEAMFGPQKGGTVWLDPLGFYSGSHVPPKKAFIGSIELGEVKVSSHTVQALQKEGLLDQDFDTKKPDISKYTQACLHLLGKETDHSYSNFQQKDDIHPSGAYRLTDQFWDKSGPTHLPPHNCQTFSVALTSLLTDGKATVPKALTAASDTSAEYKDFLKAADKKDK